MTVITLTTDFGGKDGYTGAVKGVILGLNPEAKLIDVTHEIRPQGILEAAFVLSTVYKYFPAGTIHLAVVDPGVGTARRGLIISTPAGFFTGPDNGIFTFILRDFYSGQVNIDSGKITLPPSVTAVSLTNPEYWLKKVSNTFHGRDVFAPAAAHLSLGVPLCEFGEPVHEIAALPGYQPVCRDKDSIHGHVIHIDRFGNIITDVRESDLPRPVYSVTVEIKGYVISRLVRTYADFDGLAALFGSSENLEIALTNGSAADVLKASINDEIRITCK